MWAGCSRAWRFHPSCPGRKRPCDSIFAWRRTSSIAGRQSHQTPTHDFRSGSAHSTSASFVLIPYATSQNDGNPHVIVEYALARVFSISWTQPPNWAYRHHWGYRSGFRTQNQSISFLLMSWPLCFRRGAVWWCIWCSVVCVIIQSRPRAQLIRGMFWRWRLVWLKSMELGLIIQIRSVILRPSYSFILFSLSSLW